ncbi:MAG: hypothetical protein HRT88_22785, partial [Lentisphaeraceae bacterium]|nr:hypothetical protein [Lentisphaeraceae bacterium]
GTNDTPVASVDTGAGHENETVTVDVLANDTDIDHNDQSSNFTLNSVEITTNEHTADYDAAKVTTASTVSVVDNKLEFVAGDEFDYLATGKTATVIVSYEMQDNEGLTSTSTATITITGTNDTPVASVDTDAGHENETVTVDVLANDTDIDHTDQSSNFTLNSVVITTNAHSTGYDAAKVTTAATVSVVGNKLEFVAGDEFDYLATGDTATVIVSYEMQDNEGLTSTSTATITITGTNDAATVSSATETLTETNAVLTKAGKLSSSDVDNDDNSFIASTTPGTIGTLVIDSAGNWQFTAKDAFDRLSSGDSVNETFTVASIDGTESSIEITINGTNEVVIEPVKVQATPERITAESATKQTVASENASKSESRSTSSADASQVNKSIFNSNASSSSEVADPGQVFEPVTSADASTDASTDENAAEEDESLSDATEESSEATGENPEASGESSEATGESPEASGENPEAPGESDDVSFMSDEAAFNELLALQDTPEAMTQQDLDSRVSLGDTLLGDFDCFSI